jgi:threonine-phosphate decarboxylase
MSGHGGDIYAASRRTGIPLGEILDFSASINPAGMPEGAVRAIENAVAYLCHYPEPYSEELTGHIARHLSIDPEAVVCGNGSTELIYLVPRVLKPRRVLIPRPTFMEYGKACLASGASEIKSLSLEAEKDFDIEPNTFIAAMTEDHPCDMAFICNPNNPTGRLVTRDDVLQCAEAAREASCYLVVDEAFIDFCPEASVVREVKDNPYLIVLRSMTKFYALAGLRIGCAVFHPSLVERMAACKEPWTVNTLAQRTGIASLEDDGFREASLSAMKEEKEFMEGELGRMGVSFIPSRANYYLLRISRAEEVRAGLEQRGILVRSCSTFPGLDGTYLRIAVRSRRENSILFREMADICAHLS